MAFSPLILGLIAAALPQSTPKVEVLHANLPGWPESEVPGLPGTGFRFFGVPFYDLNVAPNGRYALIATTDGPVFRVLIVDGEYVLGSGDNAPWESNEKVDFFECADITSSGVLGLSTRTVGGSNADDAYIVRRSGSGWTVAHNESDPVANRTGVQLGPVFYNLNILEDLRLSFTNRDMQGVGWGFEDAAFFDGQVLMQTGMDAPSGQFDGASFGWGSFHKYHGLCFDPHGSSWIAHGTLWPGTSSGPEVAVVNNQVRVQEGYQLPNSQFSQTVLRITHTAMGDDASWWAIGKNADDREGWVVRDGLVVARSGSPIAANSTLVWTDSFLSGFGGAGSNEKGQSYILGATEVGGVTKVVLVIEHQVVLIENDLLDLNGDGLLTEDIELLGVELIGGGGGGLDNLGRLTTTLRIRENSTGTVGRIIARITPGGPGLTLSNLRAGQTASIQVNDGSTGQVSRVAFSLAGPGPTQVNTPLGEILLSLSAPWKETTTKPIDALGKASWTQAIPAALAGASVWAQAAVYGPAGIKLSNAVATTIQ